MDMKIAVPYKMTNTVVEFEENQQIGWRHFGGHIWRYILEPVDGGTKLTEQFDYKNNKSPLMLKIMRSIANNEKSMIKTLENIEKHFAS